MSDFTIKQIFQDHWDSFVGENNNIIIRPVVFEEVNKIINCGNPDYGYALYVCEHCGKFLKVPFRCKSRFCNTCGVKYAQDRALSMIQKSIRCKHRHIVFTMSDKLWDYFQKYRFLLDGLSTFRLYSSLFLPFILGCLIMESLYILDFDNHF